MTAVDLTLLAGLLEDELRQRCADPSPVRAPGETEFVDSLYSKDPAHAEEYVARRLVHAIRRLRPAIAQGDEAWKCGDVVENALVALGGYAHLRDLLAVNA